MKRYKLGVIGAGNMGMAIARGAVAAEECAPDEILLFNRSAEKREAHAAQGFGVTDDYTGLYACCDWVLLAVKPQNYEEVLAALRPVRTEPKPVVLSIAAGVRMERMEQALGADCPIIRAMPNTPLLIGRGATVLCRNAAVTDEQMAAVRGLFDQLGVTAEFTNEDQLNDIIPFSGSTPAYVYLFIEYMMRSAKAHGLPEEDTMTLLCENLIGAAELAMASGQTPEALTQAVCSPGGTTIQAVQVLRNGLEELLREANERCIERAYELGK